MKIALYFASAIILVAVLFQISWPVCNMNSPHGSTIGGVIRIRGCP
jgi:hypothetical protein